MKVSNRGLAELVSHEGIVTSRYRDSVGVWTIGVGHTAAAGPPNPANDSKVYSVADMMELFRKDVVKYENDVARAINVPLKQHQFDALVSFHYNTGAIARASLTTAINAGDFSRAADLFMQWVKPAEIKKRREAEQKLFRDGTYSGGGMANVYPASPGGAVQWAKGQRVNVFNLLGEERQEEVSNPETEILKRGSQGDAVRAWQQVLNKAGFPVNTDGDFGPGTEAATRQLQTFLKIAPDGRVGPATKSAAEEYLAKSDPAKETPAVEPKPLGVEDYLKIIDAASAEIKKLVKVL